MVDFVTTLLRIALFGSKVTREKCPECLKEYKGKEYTIHKGKDEVVVPGSLGLGGLLLV